MSQPGCRVHSRKYKLGEFPGYEAHHLSFSLITSRSLTLFSSSSSCRSLFSSSPLSSFLSPPHSDPHNPPPTCPRRLKSRRNSLFCRPCHVSSTTEKALRRPRLLQKHWRKQTTNASNSYAQTHSTSTYAVPLSGRAIMYCSRCAALKLSHLS